MSTVGQLDSGTGGTQSPGPPPPTTNTNSLEKKKTKKDGKRKGRAAVDEMTAEEREAVTIVFHQFETGLREGTIFTKVKVMENDRRITKQTLIISQVSSQC